MKKKPAIKASKIKLNIEIIPLEHVPVEKPGKPKRQPKEDFKQGPFRDVQETSKRGESSRGTRNVYVISGQ